MSTPCIPPRKCPCVCVCARARVCVRVACSGSRLLEQELAELNGFGNDFVNHTPVECARAVPGRGIPTMCCSLQRRLGVRVRAHECACCADTEQESQPLATRPGRIAHTLVGARNGRDDIQCRSRAMTFNGHSAACRTGPCRACSVRAGRPSVGVHSRLRRGAALMPRYAHAAAPPH